MRTLEPSRRAAARLLDLSSCLERVRRRDHAAAGDLVKHLLPLVRRIVCHRCPWQAEPEDLCQAVFLRIFLNLEQYAGDAPFEHWVARVAQNVCRDHGRRVSRSRELRWTDLGEEAAAALLNHAAEDAGSDPAETLATRDWINWMLNLVSVEDRLVLRLLDLEEHTALEVSRLTGWSQGGVRVRASRARSRLRRRLAEHSVESRSLGFN